MCLFTCIWTFIWSVFILLHEYVLSYSYSETRCNTLQHTTTHCNALQHTVTHCNTKQHIAALVVPTEAIRSSLPAYTHCNSLQLTATHCTILQHTATHCSTLHQTATHCNTLQHTSPHSLTFLGLYLYGIRPPGEIIRTIWYTVTNKSTRSTLSVMTHWIWKQGFSLTKVGLDIFHTNADSQWNPVYKAFHRIRFCGNEPIGH